MNKMIFEGNMRKILIRVFAVLLLFSLQSKDMYGGAAAGAAESIAQIIERAKRFAKAVSELSIGVVKACLNTPFDAPELSFGTPDLTITHIRSVDPGEGYTESEALVEPFTTFVAVSLLTPYIPKTIQRYYEALQKFSPEQMFAIDFCLLLGNMCKKRISVSAFPVYANRMMQKISLTTESRDIEQLATELTVVRAYKGKQDLLAAMRAAKKANVFVDQVEAGKKLSTASRLLASGLSDEKYNLLINRIETGKSHFASQGPAQFYNLLPDFARKALDGIKFSVNTGIKEQASLFAHSQVAPSLWEVAASSRAKLKYSDRTAEAMAFITIVQDKSREFTAHDLESLVYWARLHAGEWISKVNQEDKEVVKKPLEEYLSALQKAVAARGYATAANDLQDVLVKVQQKQVPIAWCKLVFPEPRGTSQQLLKPYDLIDHIWNSFLHLSNKDFISMYPFAAGGIGEVETNMMVQAIFQQNDRDITAAMSSFKESDEGKELAQAFDAAQAERRQLKDSLGLAKTEEYEELKSKYDENLKTYFETQQQLRKGASEFPYITTEEEMMAFFEGRKAEALSAMDRMMRRFRELQEMAQSRDKFSNAIRANGPLLIALGFSLNEFFEKFASVGVDKNKSYMRSKFVSEKENLSALTITDAAPAADASATGAADSSDAGVGDLIIGGDSATGQDASATSDSTPQSQEAAPKPLDSGSQAPVERPSY